MKPTSKNIVTTVKVKAREVNDLLFCFFLGVLPERLFSESAFMAL